MPRKVFVAGEILTAADVNTNLADQAVMTFAGTAARGSAIGTAVEGMVTYLEDTDQLEVYDGSDWSSASNFLFGTATPTEGQVATFSTAVSGYVPADAPSGKVLQVVSTTKTDFFTTTSTSMVDITGLSASITPSSTSSKILVLASLHISNASGGGDYFVNLVRDATAIAQATAGTSENSTAYNVFANAYESANIPINFLDSPNSTSALTYKLQVKIAVGTATVNRRGNSTAFGAVSTITVIEIAG